MIEYEKTGTVRLYWNKEDSTKYGLLINNVEPPSKEPEENAYLSGMSQFKVPKDHIGVYTFDLNYEEDTNTINKCIKAIDEGEKYFSFVRMSETGSYLGFYISSEKPDLKYSTFNLETLNWDLPEDYETIKFEDAKNNKLAEISENYLFFDANGTYDTSLGFPLQVGQAHLLKLDGAIRLTQATGNNTLYITDANNVTHTNISVDDAFKVLVECMKFASSIHYKKQMLRKMVLDPFVDTIEKIEAINWNMEISSFT